MVKIVDIYKEIFLGTIVIDDEEDGFLFKINLKKTIISIKQKYDNKWKDYLWFIR